jgi:hypothetical protein
MITPDPGGRGGFSTITLLDSTLVCVPVVAHRLEEAISGPVLPWWQELATCHPGQFAVARLAVGDREVAVVSLYGKWDRGTNRGLGGGWRGAETTLHRALSDLTRLFLERGSTEIILGGISMCSKILRTPVRTVGTRSSTALQPMTSDSSDHVAILPTLR